jgi:hypothetical protein
LINEITIFQQDVDLTTAAKRSWTASIKRSCAGSAWAAPFTSTTY